MKCKLAALVLVLMFTASMTDFKITFANDAGNTFYVDAGNENDGTGTIHDPFKTIQQACDVVQQGDTVIVKPGIYYEFVELSTAGTKERPIIFRAENNGEYKTVITGADRSIREKAKTWKLYDGTVDGLQEEAAGKNVYYTEFDYEPSRVLYDSVDLMPYVTLEGLLTNIIYPTEGELYMEGAEHGWVYNNGRLFVRLHPSGKYGDLDPNNHIMKVSPPAYYDADGTKVNIDGADRKGIKGNIIGSKSANFWIDIKPYGTPAPLNPNPLAAGGTISKPLAGFEDITTGAPAHVVIEGFTFETPGYAGVYVRASDVTVRNCWFRGVRSAVYGGSRWFDDRFTSDNITVEYCDYTQFPTFQDMVDIMNKSHDDPKVTAQRFYWWQKKGTFNNTRVKDKFDYETSSFVSKMGRNWTLRNNYIWECFDGMGYTSGLSRTEIRDSGKQFEVGSDGIKIYNNRFERCVDNAIEFENRGMNYEVYNNEFIDQFWPISWQPLNGKPFPTNIFIYKNIFYTSPEIGELYLNFGKYQSGFVKLGADKSQWLNYPWMKNQPWNPVKNVPDELVRPEEDGIRLYNNTVVLPKGYFLEKVNGDANMFFDNISFVNNIFVTDLKKEGAEVPRAFQTGETLMLGTLLYFENNMFSPSYEVSDYPATDVTANGGIRLTNPADVGFSDMENLDFTLKSDSIARGRGKVDPDLKGSFGDLGAIPYGSKWNMKGVGVYQTGDVNTDGQCDILDTIKVARLIGKKLEDKEYEYTCDINADGVIDDKDFSVVAGLSWK